MLLLTLLACGADPDPKPVGGLALLKPAALDGRWAHARCNDGSPFGLTLRDQGSDTWVIKVAGGYFCDDVITPCRSREPRFTTSPKAPSLDGVGLFSRDPSVNPHFASANHVELHYCSSDLWLGDGTDRRETTGDPEGWYFAGRHNLRAGLELLLRDHGLDRADGVLIVGHSAGGMGVVGSFDTIASLVGQDKLKVVLDGAWVPPQPLERTPRADRWGPLHPQCAAAVEDPVTCVFGPVWYPWLRDTGVPILVQQSGIDPTQTRVYDVKRGPKLAAWRQGARDSMAEVGWLFSGGSRYHVLSFEPKFDAGDPSFADVLGRFWTGGAPERVLFDYEERE